MKYSQLLTTTCMLVLSTALFASPREQIVKQYITDLGHADYKHISNLFTANGHVISTSRGKVNAKEFFYSFLPALLKSETQLKEIFSDSVGEKLTARFHFSYTMKDGEKGEGEYVDEFIFTEKSDKLAAVYMFENLKFPEA